MNRLDFRLKFYDPFAAQKVQEFCFVTDIEIDSSYDNLTDKATVILPKKIRFVKADKTPVDNITTGENALFKIGDKAEIEIGYNTELKKFFQGYIAGIRTKFPLQFKLEDEVYKLKQNNITLSLDNPSLEDLLGEIMPTGITYEITAQQNLGKFRITNASAAEVLDELRKKHGIYSFFRDGVLYVGLSVNPSLQSTFRFEFNTPSLIDGDNLEYIDISERKIKVVCKSIDSQNNALEATAGDADGETRTLYFNNYTLEALQATADRLAEELKYSGYEGNFTIFANSRVQHGDVVELINRTIPEQSGAYLVTRVVTRAGWGTGGRQDVYIKQKIYDLVEDENGVFKQKALGE